MSTTPNASVRQPDAVDKRLSQQQLASQDHTLFNRFLSKSVLGLISLFMLIPILIVLLSWTQPVADIWSHMAEYVLPQVLKNTAILLSMVIAISGIIGTTLAWITSMYRFPGRRFFVGIDVAVGHSCLCIGVCDDRYC